MSTRTWTPHVTHMKKTGDNALKGVASNLNKQVMMRGALFSVTDFLQGTGDMGDAEAKSYQGSTGRQGFDGERSSG